MNLKSYAEWIASGRQVKRGETATHFAIGPDDQAIALFGEEQTDELKLQDREGWPIITREEHTAPTPPTVRVSHNPNTGATAIWCGANQKVIKSLKKGGFRFDTTTYRWRATRHDIDKVVDSLEAHGCKVVRE